MWNFRRVVKIWCIFRGEKNLEAERLAEQPGLVEALCDQQLGPEVLWTGKEELTVGSGKGGVKNGMFKKLPKKKT